MLELLSKLLGAVPLTSPKINPSDSVAEPCPLVLRVGKGTWNHFSYHVVRPEAELFPQKVVKVLHWHPGSLPMLRIKTILVGKEYVAILQDLLNEGYGYRYRYQLGINDLPQPARKYAGINVIGSPGFDEDLRFSMFRFT